MHRNEAHELLTVSKLLIWFHLDGALLCTLEPSQQVLVLLLVVVGAEAVGLVTFSLLLPPPLPSGSCCFFFQRRWLMLGRVILL